jgi:predicted phosphate transport protein (TIGR00153 family)
MTFDSVLKFFVPKDYSYFPLFEQCGRNVLEASALLVKMMTHGENANPEEIAIKIKEIEKKGDNVSHIIYEHLNSTFITPFDREDMHELVSNIDNVLDMIDGASKKLILYKPKRLLPVFRQMAEIIQESAKEIDIAVNGLRNAANNRSEIRRACINLNTLENRADELYHNGISELFEREKEARELIKAKAILETLERCVDSAEDVSDTIKGIMIKMA